MGGTIRCHKSRLIDYYICSNLLSMKKALKLNFDFSDEPKLVELLRVQSAQRGITQKRMLVEALNRYFSDKQEEQFIMSAANNSFKEWNNPADEIYDSL
jgi:hypothetical protein